MAILYSDYDLADAPSELEVTVRDGEVVLQFLPLGRASVLVMNWPQRPGCYSLQKAPDLGFILNAPLVGLVYIVLGGVVPYASVAGDVVWHLELYKSNSTIASVHLAT